MALWTVVLTLLLSLASLSAEIKVYAVVMGKVQKVFVKEGDRVKKGELLVKIEDRLYEAKRKQFLGQLKAAKGSLYKVKRDYDRLKELFDRDLLSLTRLEDQKAKLDEVEGRIDEIKAKIEEVVVLKSYTEIRSPVKGRVKALLVEEGSYVNGVQVPHAVVIIEKSP